MESEKLIETILAGGIGVLPTDTIYGLVGRADNKETVERIYKIRKRNPDKPFIILINSIEDLNKFNVTLEVATKNFINNKKLWPGKVSIIFPVTEPNFEYLTRKTLTLGFRIPEKPELKRLLENTGPLVAPSANPEGQLPAKNIEEAKKYFGDKLDFYIDEGILESEPSTLIKINDNKVEILRQGAVKVL